MTIVTRVLEALEPLIVRRVVAGVRLVGLTSQDGTVRPVVSIAVSGPNPERHVEEISRLIACAGLSVEWVITSPSDRRWARAKHLLVAEDVSARTFSVEPPAKVSHQAGLEFPR